MQYDFSDIVTGEEISPEAATYSALELVKEHRARYVFRTSKGNIILRRMPLRMQRVIESARRAHGPRTRELLAELESIRPFIEGIPEEEIDQETKSRAMDITRELMLQDLAPLGVVVVPELYTMDDYDDLLAMLEPGERITLQEAISELASVRPIEQIDTTPLEIAERLGVQVVPDDMLANLTVSQAEYYINRINAERKAIERMQRSHQ